MPPSSKAANRLIHEKSPYLLQHAANPVDWYPWGDEAFEQARTLDRPVFLSIGYSTCHWCHVMERESFEDPGVAAAMNETFINVKVDREERPDIDSVYMTVCQMLTSQGGWPLTIIMTPDKKPFFAGTYFPRDGRFGRPGMLDIVPRIREVWEQERETIRESADEIANALSRTATAADTSDGEQGPEALDRAFQELSGRFDDQFGGFGSRPKFPTPHNFLFLLRYWHRTGERRALEMAERSVRSMRSGGVYDQVGFGFHRYSTDERWFVPHFEKMLYDQALMALAAVETFQATRDSFYMRVADEVFEYVLRDLTSREGGFYTAEDADSDGEEGKFYVWDTVEMQQVLGEEDASIAKTLFGVEDPGNYLDEATQRRTGASILHQPLGLETVSEKLGLPRTEVETKYRSIRRRLLEARSARIRPLLDDKILTDWNGLMIGALALAAQAAHRPQYAEASDRAAGFVLKHLRDDAGRLLHRYRDGQAAIKANIDDYAFLVYGLIELFQATADTRNLLAARELTDIALEHYWDGHAGGFFFTPDDGETLLMRQKEFYDGAIPSGNSVFLVSLLKLARLLGESSYEEKASDIISAAGPSLQSAASAHTMLLTGLDFVYGSPREVIIVEGQDSNLETMLETTGQVYAPNQVVIVVPAETVARAALFDAVPYLQTYRALEGKTTAYVCERQVCKQPASDPDTLRAQLEAG